MEILKDVPPNEGNIFKIKDAKSTEKYKNQDVLIKDDAYSKSNMDSTVHYLSPATSFTVNTLYAEDDRSQLPYFTDFYRYLGTRPTSGYSGEYSYFSGRSSEITEMPSLERTLAIIKPDAVYYEDVILRKIFTAGFKILQKRKLHLTPEQVSELYAQYYGDISFPYLVVSMSAGPVIIMCLAAMDAVNKWKNIVHNTGTMNRSWFYPRSMKTRFGSLQSVDNVLHASEDIASANREIRYFFPQMILEPLLKYEAEITDYLSLYVNPTLLDALTSLCKRKPIEPILFFADWLLQNNPYQPKMKPEIAQLPT